MNKSELLNTATRTFYKFGFKLKKHSPEILVAAGVIGTVASTVMACKATTKLNGILENSKDDIDKIRTFSENKEWCEVHDYTEEDKKKDLTIVYAQTAVKVAKLYAPAVALGTVSIAAMLMSHNILRKRNIALAAAYTAVDKGFKEYRGRVIERFGKDMDRELKYNIKAKQVETVVKKEDGTESTVVETVNVADPTTYSDYSRFFDEGCPGWTKDPELNLTFLKQCERYANNKLQTKGYLFLNEVYDMIGIPRTKAGQVVGWIYDEKNPIGDNFVDFGIYNINRTPNRDFVNGYERSILLDFNVDGNILDFI